MPRGYLINVEEGLRVPVDDELVVGRGHDCGLILEDTSASRRHVEIQSRENRFHWKDLGSTNGTLLNGDKAPSGELRHGDMLQIGDSVFRFEIEHDTAIGHKKEPRLFQETILDNSGVAQPAVPQEKTSVLLEAVYSVVNEIATNYEPCSLMDRILKTLMGAINIQRGAILLMDDLQLILPCRACGHIHSISNGVLRPVEPAELQLSKTVVNRVMSGGENVLFQDYTSDSGFQVSHSMLSMKLRSLICVPLRAKHGILGILYLDTDRQDQRYNSDDLLLASAVGNSAGLALENAEMHQQMLEKQRIEQEIQTAWTIQEGFLIKDWQQTDPRFEVYAETRPAKVVGGDFYDFVQPDVHVAGMLIGDVSGKGVPAALTMAQLLAEFRLIARDVASPAEVLRRLNQELAMRSRRGLFCSLCYITVDLKTGAALYANAGHPPAALLGRERAGWLPEASGPPAGILEGADWEDVMFQLAAGDGIGMYTDGALEARQGASGAEPERGGAEEFGLERLHEVFGATSHLSAASVVGHVFEAVLNFAAPAAPHDDCTLAVLKYKG